MTIFTYYISPYIESIKLKLRGVGVSVATVSPTLQKKKVLAVGLEPTTFGS